MKYKQINLINYKAFDNVIFDLTSKKDTPKNLAIIYGPNGSGKSTLLESFTVLYDLMHTMSFNKSMGKLQEKLASDSNNYNSDDLQFISDMISNSFTTTAKISTKIQGTDQKRPTTIKITFEHEGLNGSYIIMLKNRLIIYEELNYVLSKNQSCFFKLDSDSFYINQNLFSNKKEYTKIVELYSQSWGKHCLLSLINNELDNYNSSYIKNSYSSSLINLIDGFEKTSFRICNYSSTVEHLGIKNNYLLDNITNGFIKFTTKKEIKKLETALLPILKIVIDDLKSIKYMYDEANYKLTLIKEINNKEITIPYDEESSGIKELINILPFIIQAINGDVVILDEYANHIHDTISYNFIRGIFPMIKGQLIITTHSTVLLFNSDENLINSHYFIQVKDSIRSIDCITDIEIRLRSNYNYQKKYLVDDLYNDYRNKITPITQLYSEALKNYHI